MKGKEYFKDIDFIRLLSCIAVFLYHLDLLKGGYLAVCTFFVLSGFLSVASSLKKENFSIISYYKNRFINIYIPFFIVVFLSILFVTVLTDFNWINLKPETTSVILGYNNYWQLNANLDYFTRLVTSPFTHFWYMGILLQFELVFPFIFIILKRIGNKIHKIIPCLVLGVISISSCIYFYITSVTTNNITTVYYDTFTRLFSILFGVTIGFIYHYYKNYVPKVIDKKIINRVIFYLYIIILISMFIYIPADSKFFTIAMITTTLITCRLIKYGTIIYTEKNNFITKTIKIFSSISYEVYLVQYPVIFLFQYLNIDNNVIKILLIMNSTYLISFIIHFSLNYKKNNNGKIKDKILKIIVLLMLLSGSSLGFYKYIISHDYTSDAQALKEKLAENEKLMIEKQNEFLKNKKDEDDAWEKTLNDLNAGEENIKNIVSNLSVVGIGDSVILDAIPNLYKLFPNGYFDAKQSRTDYEADDIIIDLKNKNMLGNPIVFGLGTNGQCGLRCQREIVRLCGDRKIFWINVSNDWEVHVNSKIKQLTDEFDNVYLIDWYTMSKDHPEYFIYDGTHLKKAGQAAYANAIYDSIYKVYLDEYQQKKNEIINKHNDEQKQKISFYGNELLLNSLDYIKDSYINSSFSINKDYNFNNLYEDLKYKKDNNLLTHRLVFVFDEKIEMNEQKYNKLIELCKEHEITFIVFDKNNKIIKEENVTYINIYNEITKEDKYLMFDKIHLSDEGNKYLSNIIKDTIK